MKKNTRKKLIRDFIIRKRINRFLIKNSNGKKKTSIKDQFIFVRVPPVLDIYNKDNHTRTTNFFNQLRLQSKQTSKRVRICFRDTKRITAAAGILLVAEIERIVSHYGKWKFRATYPNATRDRFGSLDYTVESILNQIGIYKILGQHQRSMHPVPLNVGCWQAQSGTMAEGETAGVMLKSIASKVPRSTTTSLYRGAIEALANSVEHAYTGIRKDGLDIISNKWWMFTATMNNRLVVLVCDLGVGIPNTIRKTQTQSLLNHIFETFGYKAESDAGWIKTATLVKETRTEAHNRGKGGGDLRNLVKIDKTAKLSIFSNRGYYAHTTLVTKSERTTASPEYLWEHRNSIFGTIVEWSVEMKG